MAASAWLIHDFTKEYFGNKIIDFDADTFNMTLHTVTSTVHTVSTNAFSAATLEVANGLGYTSGGEPITNPTWFGTTGVATFDCDDVFWTAAGGSIVARFAAIRDMTVNPTPVIEPVICSTLLDTTPDDVTATTGNTFTVQINVSGVFTLS